jgi:hypothetical protein
MNEYTPRHTIAQELGADPESAAHTATGEIQPTSLATLIRHLTQKHPLVMLGLAFVVGVVYAGRLR